MKKYISFIVIILIIGLVAVFNTVTNTTKEKEQESAGHSHGNSKKILDATLVFNQVMVVETTQGNIEIAVLKKDIPQASRRMLSLAKKNKFKDIDVETADDWHIMFDELDSSMKPLERETANNLLSCRGAVGLARRKSMDSATNAMFIIREASFSVLDGYTIFGYVVKGMDAVDALTEEDSIISTSVRGKTKDDEKAVVDVFKNGNEDLALYTRFQMRFQAEEEAKHMKELQQVDKMLPGGSEDIDH